MSIILGALGGAGEALQNVGSTMLKAELDRDARAQDSDLTLQRAKALEQFKMELGNQERTAQTQRVDAAAGKIADQKVGEKRRTIEGGIVDRASWTPEQQAAVEQSLELDRQSAMSDPKTRTEAAIQTGDIGPKDAAVLNQKSEADLTRLMLGEQRNQTMALIAAGHDETRRLVAGMAASSKRDSASKEDRVLVHQFLAQFDRKISGNQSEIRSLRASMKNTFDEEEKKGIQGQIAELETANRNLEKAQMQYARDSGVKVPEVAQTPAPAPSPAAGSAKPWEKYRAPAAGGRSGK